MAVSLVGKQAVVSVRKNLLAKKKFLLFIHYIAFGFVQFHLMYRQPQH